MANIQRAWFMQEVIDGMNGMSGNVRSSFSVGRVRLLTYTLVQANCTDTNVRCHIGTHVHTFFRKEPWLKRYTQTAIERGDFTQKIFPDAFNGEMLRLVNTVNRILDKLSSIAEKIIELQMATSGIEVRDYEGTWRGIV